jgi:hypothetical protein
VCVWDEGETIVLFIAGRGGGGPVVCHS